MILAKTTSGRNCVDWHIKLSEEWKVSIQVVKGGVDPSFPELVQIGPFARTVSCQVASRHVAGQSSGHLFLDMVISIGSLCHEKSPKGHGSWVSNRAIEVTSGFVCPGHQV